MDAETKKPAPAGADAGSMKLDLALLARAKAWLRAQPEPPGRLPIFFLPPAHPYWQIYDQAELCRMFCSDEVRRTPLIPTSSS